MVPFDELTRTGKVRRLRRLAAEVLPTDFGLDPQSIRLVADHSFNTVFRVDAGGERFALRVGGEIRIHSLGVEDIEASWLDALASTGFGTPQNIATSDGRRWVQARHANVSKPRTCTLFTWVEGAELRSRLSPASSASAGQLLGQLHTHAESLRLAYSPALVSGIAATKAIYFGGADLVSTYESAHGSLFQQAVARVQVATDELWATDATHEQRVVDWFSSGVGDGTATASHRTQ